MPVVYQEVKLEAGYRIDLIVENKFIIEIKAVFPSVQHNLLKKSVKPGFYYNHSRRSLIPSLLMDDSIIP